MKRSAVKELKKKWFKRNWDYELCHHSTFDYSILKEIMYIKRAGKGENLRFSDCFIMADTETSKSPYRQDNHVCAWTISIRAFDQNIATIYGHKPSTFVETVDKLLINIDADKIIIYFHNLGYDWVFLRRHLIRAFGEPEHQLNTKPYYPIFIEFSNGLELRDSYILAQRSLEKWADDLNVEHKKAVGQWDYDLIRNQDAEFSPAELEYIEHDTLAGVECLQATMDNLHKHVYSMPYTATGIPREEVRKRGRQNRAHDRFLKQVLSYDQQKTAEEWVYHGGYTHANRHAVKWIWEDVSAYDFASSYPFIMISEKFPCNKFEEMGSMSPAHILKYSKDNAYIFKFVAYNIEIKDNDIPMPALQFSKCVSSVNAITDNGRVLQAEYIEIWLTEIDLEIIAKQYKVEKSICVDCLCSRKDYLPRWFTDYVFELFQAKTQLKGGDPVLYSIAKATLNSLYGMCCQRPIKQLIVENYKTGEYLIDQAQDDEDIYNKYVRRYTSVLNYQIGIWVTAYAMRNLFTLGKCCGHWLYSDTDSCYGQDWDTDAVNRYNEECRKKLIKNGYGAVQHNGRDYWLGVAEFDGHYKEFIALHAKCYAVRKDDDSIKITVAGVPKSTGAKCINDLNEFKAGFIFSGEITGKKTHKHIIVDDIYIDEACNECGDSIDLYPCDYQLSDSLIMDFESFLYEEVELQIYDE